MCHSLECPDGKTVSGRQFFAHCNSTVCTDKDYDTCCVDENTCAKYKCPIGYTIKENALELPCADENCTDTPWPMCCTERAPCTDLQCPQNWLKTPANNSLCLGYACDQLVDKEVCCEEAPTCA